MTAPLLNAAIQGQGTISADNLNTYIQNCTNIAQLRSFIGLPGMCVFIDGLTTQGDGGSGPFYWNTTSIGPDNGTSVVVPQPGVPGAWVRLSISQSSPINITNISNLENFDGGASSPTVFVEGYYNPGDGGGGIYVYEPSDNTSASNGGSIIIDAQNHRYYLVNAKNGVSVLQFGAVGDGATNDYSSISSALTYMGSIGGGIVYMPPTGSSYFIETGLVLPPGVHLQGAKTSTQYSFNMSIAQWTSTGTWIQCTDPINTAVMLGNNTSEEGLKNGSSLSGLNFIYEQTGIGGSTITITTYPFAFTVSGDFCQVSDIMIIGASHGFDVNYNVNPSGTDSGKASVIRNIMMWPFITGFRTINVNDTVILENITISPMYDNSNLDTYMWANALGWDCNYTDNIIVKGLNINNINTGIKFTNGTVLSNTHSFYNGMISDVFFNLVSTSLSVSSGSTVVVGQMVNVNSGSQSPTQFPSYTFNLASDYVNLSIANMICLSGASVFTVGNGTSGSITISNLYVEGYAPTQICFGLQTGSVININGYTVNKNGGGNYVAGSGEFNLNTSKYGIWTPFASIGTPSFTGTGSFSVLTSGLNLNPVQRGMMQMRISGTVFISTGQSGGTISIREQFFNEIIVSGISATTSSATENFDSNWIDISSGSNTVGDLQFDATSGVVFSFNSLSVEWR